MKKWMILFALLSALFLIAGCEEPVEEEAPDEAAEIADGSKGLFYRVEGGENDLYLFGTLHFGEEGMYPLHEKVYEALEKTDVLGLEIDLAEVSDAELNEKVAQIGFFQDDTEITDIISDQLFEEFFSLVEGPGVEREMLKNYKPWFAAFELSVLAILEAGYNPEAGVENYLLEKAEEKEMEVIGLETVSKQFAPFEKLSDESQAIYLEQTIEEYEEAEEELEELFYDWKNGNDEAYAENRKKQIEKAETESLREFQIAFTHERDEYMAQQIEELLIDDTGHNYFIAVGSLHLAGENSIVDYLDDKGYEVVNMYQ